MSPKVIQKETEIKYEKRITRQESRRMNEIKGREQHEIKQDVIVKKETKKQKIKEPSTKLDTNKKETKKQKVKKESITKPNINKESIKTSTDTDKESITPQPPQPPQPSTSLDTSKETSTDTDKESITPQPPQPPQPSTSPDTNRETNQENVESPRENTQSIKTIALTLDEYKIFVANCIQKLVSEECYSVKVCTLPDNTSNIKIDFKKPGWFRDLDKNAQQIIFDNFQNHIVETVKKMHEERQI